MQGNKLQDDLLAKEQAKIDARRQKNEVLRLRFLQNAKKRLIGIDTDGLDAQIAEKQRMNDVGDNQLRLERSQALEIERLMTDAESEEKQMRDFQQANLRDDWARAAEEKRNRRDDTPDFDEKNAGPASAQILSGADVFRTERKLAQQAQMRLWINQQIAEKGYQNSSDKSDDVNYLAMLKAIDEIRDTADAEEIEMKKYIQNSVRSQNKELAEAQRLKALPSKEYCNSSLPAFDEDKGRAMDANGRIVQKDMFKGFTKVQQMKMLQENDILVADKRARDEQERQMERYWAAQGEMASRAMEQAEYDEKMTKEFMNSGRLDILTEQIEEQRKIKEARDASKNGTIDLDSGFYAGFGRSHR